MGRGWTRWWPLFCREGSPAGAWMGQMTGQWFKEAGPFLVFSYKQYVLHKNNIYLLLKTNKHSKLSPEVQYMDKLFEDGIKLFCVDVVLNHFDGLKVWHATLQNVYWALHKYWKHSGDLPAAVLVSGSRSELWTWAPFPLQSHICKRERSSQPSKEIVSGQSVAYLFHPSIFW